MPVRRPVEVTQPKSTKDIPVESLFNWGRVKKDAPLLHKMLFLAYLPFGFVLLVARTLLFFIVCMGFIVLPPALGDKILPRALRTVCGLVINHNHHTKRLTAAPYILAANHISDFDAFALYCVAPRFSTVTSAHLKSVPIIGPVYRSLDSIFVSPTPESKEQTRVEIQKRIEKNAHPVMVFPEGGLTNGKVGTLMYHKFIFSLDTAIVPVCIRMNNPWPVEHDYMGSSFAKNFFWFMLFPYNHFELDFLPVENRRPEETPEDFALRVQHLSCEKLGFVPTKYSYTDKKRLVVELKEKKKAAAAAAAEAKKSN